MKTIFRFIIAAMSAISVFSSCQKELANETASSTTDGVRIISVQFDNSTKASLSGLAPTFTNNDKIRVSNTEKSEECTVTVSATIATFTTTLSGALTAIYPADAAVLASEATDAPIASSNNFKVLATQDGTMEKAIIASATVAEGENTATFNGLTALFEITPPAGETTFTVTSLKAVVSGARTGDAVAINTEGADDAAKCVINVTVPSDGTAYVALVPGVKLSDLSFEYTIDATHGAMKGIPTKDITAAGKTDATVANTKYTIGNTNWHPYVTIGDKKWATMNIGATSATEAGKYFAWGDIVGQTPSSSTFSPGFSWTTCPFAVGGTDKLNKYISGGYYLAEGYGGDTKTVLDLADDAANANWGGSWRMPTKAEIVALASKKRGDFSSGNNFGESDTQQIFLPAAGFGKGADLILAGTYGYYWPSSLSDDPRVAWAFEQNSEHAYTKNTSTRRYYGYSVRPVSD